MSCVQEEGAHDTCILEKPSLEEELTEEVVLNIEENVFSSSSDTVQEAVAARLPVKALLNI